WVHGVQATFVRSPTYWDKPRPYVDSITVKTVLDPNQALNAWEAGQADVLFTGGTSQQLTDAAKAKGVRLYGYATPGGGDDVAFNERAPGLDDVRIRKALVLASDSADLNTKATGGTAPMVDTFFVKGTPYYNPAVRQVTNNLAAAQKLVDSYVAEKGPVTITFSLIVGRKAWGEAQLQQWSRLKGITIKEDLIPSGGVLQTTG